MLELKEGLRIIVKQFFSFAAVGVFGTSFHYAVLICSVSWLQVDPVSGSMVGFVGGAAVNYIGNYYITFQSGKSHLESSVKFFIIAFVGFVLNWVIMTFFSFFFDFYYLFSQIVTTLLVLIWNFIGNKVWTFKEA